METIARLSVFINSRVDTPYGIGVNAKVKLPGHPGIASET